MWGFQGPTDVEQHTGKRDPSMPGKRGVSEHRFMPKLNHDITTEVPVQG